MQPDELSADSEFMERTGTFLSRILAQEYRNTEELLLGIANAWREYTGAKWTWLWLLNRETGTGGGEWELRSCSPENNPNYIPAVLSAPSPFSVAEYATTIRKHVFVSTLDWGKAYKGIEYKVAAKEALEKMGCVAFDCIPILLPKPTENANESPPSGPKLQGALCAHYTDIVERLPEMGNLVTRLGEVAAMAIQSIHHTHQRNILIELNSLADQHVHRSAVNPDKNRTDYLEKVISVIKDQLEVSKVSLFYRRPFSETLQCLASTGIEDRDGQRFPQNELYRVTYELGQGLTGKCFSTSRPIVRTGEEPAHRHIWREVLDGPQDKRPAVIYPIKNPSNNECVGVIRCTEKTAFSLCGRSSRFDSLDLGTLALLSQHIAPILKSLDQNILREQSISQIKHDLYLPNEMAQDAIGRINNCIRRGFPIDPPDLKAIGAAVLISNSLIPQLGYAAVDRPVARLKETDFKRDILDGIQDPFVFYAQDWKGITLQFVGFDALPTLQLDRNLISRALVNLLTNAVRYGLNGSKIIVSAQTQTSTVRIDVSDYGIGIDDDEIEAIFEVGYRSANARAISNGTGLGLPIAAAGIQANGGTLTLTSNRAPTTFTINLPREALPKLK